MVGVDDAGEDVAAFAVRAAGEGFDGGRNQGGFEGLDRRFDGCEVVFGDQLDFVGRVGFEVFDIEGDGFAAFASLHVPEGLPQAGVHSKCQSVS